MRVVFLLAFLMAVQTQAFSAVEKDLESDVKAAEKLDKITMKRDISQMKQDIAQLKRDLSDLKREMGK